MKQLGGIDASFLYMETPETPMHVAGLTLYELPEGFSGSFHDHFVRFFEGRIHLIPIFSKKLARTILELDHPGWVDATVVDLSYHIKSVTLPKPGSFKQIEALVAELHAQPLDRSRPLWQFHVIEGLEDRKVALYSKVHHAAVDGGAGMVITQALYDLTPKPRDVAPPVEKPPIRKPSPAERAILGVNDLIANVIRQQINAVATGAQVMATVVGMLAPAPKAEAPAAGGEPEKGKKKGAAAPAVPNLVAPKTPFNVTITRERSYAARRISLADAKIVARATDTKINDVVMALCSGALRRYLQSKKALPKTPLIAFVPISLREMGNTEINNQVFGMNCDLATNVADPLERLAEIAKRANLSKTVAGATKDAAPKDFTLLGAPLLLPGLMSLYGKLKIADVIPQSVNLVISNTPGPPFPLYCAGAKVLALFPVSIPIHGIALNMTVQSYLGSLDFGITADGKAVPDVDALADQLAAAMEELKSAVIVRQEAAEKAAAKAAKAQEKNAG